MRTLISLFMLVALISVGCSSSPSAPETPVAEWSVLPEGGASERSSTPERPDSRRPGTVGASEDGVRAEPGGGTRQAAPKEGGAWGAFGDPFAEQPQPPVQLTDTSSSLQDLLENGALEGACDRYAEDPSDEKKRLLCGKSMFFYEGFGTSGVPRPLIDFLLEHFEDELGHGFSKLGLFADPSSEEGYPLGMALNEEGTELSFTCASCHFAALPDGRFSVGAPNHDYEYGLHTLSLSAFPLAVMNSLGGMGMGQAIHPEAMARIQPLVDKIDADWLLKGQFMMSMASLMGSDPPEFPEEQQAQYARWLPGTMDFVAAPLPVDDGVEVISKISAIYGIPSEEEQESSGMEHAMLGWAGNTRTVAGFLELFVDFGGGEPEKWDDDDFAPLLDYVRSLRPPEPPTQPEQLIASGEKVFLDAGCVDCHQGPRGSGLRLYDFDEIGTDQALKHWMDPELTGEACCDQYLGSHQLTYAVKSPRLVALWAMERFLHNGSIGSLEELLCMGPETQPIDTFAYSNAGHEFGCDLSLEEKVALIAYLESH